VAIGSPYRFRLRGRAAALRANPEIVFLRVPLLKAFNCAAFNFVGMAVDDFAMFRFSWATAFRLFNALFAGVCLGMIISSFP
jgi:hypothetical protein